ncbi:MAG TPA: DinB family protein [Gemmatimonadaceae bacterium]|nr:DinB family protein [Gemmatimonadaceae bacterium]
MPRRLPFLIALLAAAPTLAAAQNPVSDAFRAMAASDAKNLIAAAEDMPADKYGYKPTPAQMPFGQIMVHLSEGNDALCGTIGGVKAPTRSAVKATDKKDVLVARLKETFEFCNTALAHITDANLSEELPFFEGPKMSRARIELITIGDWADHYSQVANYMRLNGILPPTARRTPKK